jgi:putative tryptophan/tyrosine transport system substrate-binding protein
VNRREFISGAGFGLFAAPLAAEAQHSVKVHRIGYLSYEYGPSLYSEAFRQGLRELGWVEGRDISIEYRWAEEKRERLQDLANELVRLKVDIILAETTPGVLAAKKATTMIPIVFPMASEPVAAGLVASLARPGGNVTGFSLSAQDIIPKRIELLRDAVPGITRVAALVNPTQPGSVIELREAERVVRELRMQLQVFEVRDRAQLEKAFSAMPRQRVDGLIVLFDRFFITQLRAIADLAAQHRMPTIHYTSEFAEAGGLLAYGASFPELQRRAATYVDKILKGAKPADLPVEQPTKFDFVINMKTAKALGLTIPPSLLLRADQVIQ